MIIAGIDYSMSSPAIAVWDDATECKFENIKFFNLNGTKKYQGIHGNIRIDPLPLYSCPEERYLKNATWAVDVLKANGVQKVNLEGYAMNSSSGLVFNIGECAGALKRAMWEAGIPFVSNAPTAVKKSFHGKGNANKQAMVEAFVERFGVSISDILGCKFADAPANDLVDAAANMLHQP